MPRPPALPELAPAELAPQVLLASFMIEPAGSRFIDFPVPGLNLYLLTGGRMRYRRLDHTLGVAAAGDLVTFYAGYGEYEALPGAPLAIYQTHFLPAPPPRHRGVPALPPVGRLPQQLSVRNRLAEFALVFQRLMQALQDAALAWELESAAGALELLQLAFRLAAGTTPPEPRTVTPWDLLLARLDNAGDVRVSAMAGEMGYSTEHFIREFKRRYGLSPKQYVLSRRLDRARGLLHAKSSVKAAAAASGFQSPLQLNRAHRRFYGVPPTAARRKAKAADGAPPEMRPGLTVCRHIWAPGIDFPALVALT